jgi:ubiquitin C-terminal hydrolase
MWTLCATEPHAIADPRSSDILASAPASFFCSHALSRRYRASLWCPSSRVGPAGVGNLGNTCYLNSILQCLHATSNFASLLCRRSSGTRIGAAHLCYQQFRHVLASMSFSYRPFVTPASFHRSLPSPFCGFSQQDATEVLRLLLDMCSQCEGEDRRKLVEGVFGGIGSATVTCSGCGTSSVTREPFTDLSVSFGESSAAHSPTVTECLKGLFTVERLTGDAAFSCAACGGLRDATRELAIVSPPAHLIVTLNRFGFDVATGKSHKVCGQFAPGC